MNLLHYPNLPSNYLARSPVKKLEKHKHDKSIDVAPVYLEEISQSVESYSVTWKSNSGLCLNLEKVG